MTPNVTETGNPSSVLFYVRQSFAAVHFLPDDWEREHGGYGNGNGNGNGTGRSTKERADKIVLKAFIATRKMK